MAKKMHSSKPTTKQSGSFMQHFMYLGASLALLMIILSLLLKELPFKAFYLIAFLMFLVNYRSEKKKWEIQNQGQNKQNQEKIKSK